jgi:nitronate monooxygenase
MKVNLTTVLEAERLTYQTAADEGDFDTVLVWAGEVVDLIKSVARASELVAQISAEAETQLRAGAKLMR